MDVAPLKIAYCACAVNLAYCSCAYDRKKLIARAHESTMLYLVGLGLGDAADITVKGLEIVKQATRVYLEAYTSILTVGKDELVRIQCHLRNVFWYIAIITNLWGCVNH